VLFASRETHASVSLSHSRPLSIFLALSEVSYISDGSRILAGRNVTLQFEKEMARPQIEKEKSSMPQESNKQE